MANMSPKKQPMLLLNAEDRAETFAEVALGYSENEAQIEASRCLNCKNSPCVGGCPVNIQIPDFIKLITEGNYEGAYQKIAEESALPAVCGRVCPQERQCEKVCVRGIKAEPVAIGRLERFVADYHNNHMTDNKMPVEPNGHKVAVIGSGPSGLTCAGELAKKGYDVTIFEALHIAGGVLVYGIPEFRLPKKTVQKEVDGLRKMGVKIKTNTIIGKTFTIDELMNEDGFEAVFIGSGAGLPKFMNIPGENARGVYSANEFLTRINLMKAYQPDSPTPIIRPKRAIIVGGGNVAMDAARCAKRLGSEVYVLYRRTRAELPARKEEVEHAIEEGIVFGFLTNPIKINTDEFDNVKSVTCQNVNLSEPDATGRARPVPIENSEFDIKADAVIMALGTSPNPLIKSTTEGLDTNNRGGITVDEKEETSIPGVFAGGDAVTGAATVILAMGAGKRAAKSIDDYIQSKNK
ncbi:MAG: NADPH-dependent glutamate synthase [Clostridiales bacterium]|nr:NADPH-dependent glutamate synthase [Clostridiales bacterium]